MAFEHSGGFYEYLFLGVNYLTLGMYNEAIVEFQKGIAGGYDLETYHYYSGYAYERMGGFEEALDEYKMGVEAELQDSLKITIQNHLHYFLSLCRFDRQSEARSLILELSEKYKDTKLKWAAKTDAAILDFYSGRTTAADLLNTKGETDTERKISAVPCILHYYVAMSYVINISDDKNTTTIDEEKAREHLQRFNDFCANWENGDAAIGGRVETELERLKQK
jgi:tetratricopeptide (TPR) repeat protein